MLGRALGIFVRISRLDTSLIVFLSLAVPLYLRRHDYHAALERSLPLLAITMCGFILNDIHDAERDEENHSNRPLPRKQLTQTQAAIIYFALLAVALATLRAFVDAPMAAFYLLLLVALINYNYVVAFFPFLKNIYAAGTGTIPLIILALTLKYDQVPVATLAALFSFLLGRELLMDVEDLRGDGNTLARLLGPDLATYIGFALKLGSAGALLSEASGRLPLNLAVTILGLDVVFVMVWPKPQFRRVVLHAMKAQLALGIAYVATELH